MMMIRLFILPALVLLPVAGAGCGDDGSAPATVDAATENGSDAGPPPDPLAIRMGCVNAADAMQLNDDSIDEVAVAESCGLRCIGNGDANCELDCVTEQTELSPTCATCVAVPVTCAIEVCLPECAADPSSPECGRCTCGENPDGVNCIARFDTCSGMEAGLCTTEAL